MKNIISTVLCSFFAIACITGCQSTGDDTSKISRPTNVALLFSPPKRSFYIIGRVAANRPHQDPRLGYDSSQTWQETLQRQGAAKGADAVIVDQGSLNNINSVLVTGTAIRYKRDSDQPPPPAN